MKITVFLGANPGRQGKYAHQARVLGQWIGHNQHELVYGGSNNGLMGVLAQACKEAGGRVTGIMSQDLAHIEVLYPHLDSLVMVPTIEERMQRLIQAGQVSIAFPGGIGTLEEVMVALVGYKIQSHTHPCLVYNLDGFYQHFYDHLHWIAQEGFVDSDFVDSISFCPNLESLTQAVQALA